MSAGWHVPTTTPACLVCGHDQDVRMGLMRYRRAVDGAAYASGWRCRDHAACRVRFESGNPGEPYPLEDPRPEERPKPIRTDRSNVIPWRGRR